MDSSSFILEASTLSEFQKNGNAKTRKTDIERRNKGANASMRKPANARTRKPVNTSMRKPVNVRTSKPVKRGRSSICCGMFGSSVGWCATAGSAAA